MELEQPRKSTPNWNKSARPQSPGFDQSFNIGYIQRESVNLGEAALLRSGHFPKRDPAMGGQQPSLAGSSHHCLRPMAGLDSPQIHWRPLLATQNHLFPSEYNSHQFFLGCVFSWGNYQEDSHWDTLELQLWQLVTGTYLVLTVFFLCYPFLDASYILVVYPYP